MLEHGGGIGAASRAYGIPREAWLDLSTGINPCGWQPPSVPDAIWLRLPEEDDGLEQAAGSYYGTRHLLPVAGSQAAIQALPRIRPKGRVGLVSPSYAEHRHAWHSAGHHVIDLSEEEIESNLDLIEVLVICNPNNPDGCIYPRERLLSWHRALTAKGGWLVLDEAFIDPHPEGSLAPLAPRLGLIVLRSLGKFFGLAGARVGFVMAEASLLERLRDMLGPWTVSGPSRWVAVRALGDTAWHEVARARLSTAAFRQRRLLQAAGIEVRGDCLLFCYCVHEQAEWIADSLARQGILVRCFRNESALRFGLPGRESEWDRLGEALKSLRL